MSFVGLRVLLVGAGGLSCPAALALAAAGVGTLAIADDDEVERSNLHRQILYSQADVGASKAQCAARALQMQFPHVAVIPHETRFLPHLAKQLLADVDLVVEGADNFATKFLVADACALYEKPVVHGAALRWVGTVLSVGPRGRPCYRCVFEDMPDGPSPSCADAGVMGPVCGIVGALMAEAALRLAGGGEGGALVSFDGKSLAMRTRAMRPRRDCRLCGAGADTPTLDASRYAVGQ